MAGAEDLLVVSPMVAAEADYVLASRLGPKAARRFAADIADEAYDLAEWTATDHAAALTVISEQGDGDYLGIADASNVILADRHRSTTILTLDQRHFRRLRPLWGASHFTLLPTTVIIADASVLVTALADDGPDGDHARARLRGERLTLPGLADLEVASVLRRQIRGGTIDTRRAALALDDLAALPARRAPHRPLLTRCWELRDNLTPYDAAYVALAEALHATLLTADTRLARAPATHCHIEILQPRP